MKNQSKKILALFLAILLTAGLFPTAGFAAVGDESSQSPAPALLESPATSTSLPGVTPDPTPTPTPTETPVESPLPSETPLPTETPVPTPATSSSIVDVSALFGEELYAYLKTLEGDALDAALQSLTTEQVLSLLDVVSESEAEAWGLNYYSALYAPDLPIYNDSITQVPLGAILGDSALDADSYVSLPYMTPKRSGLLKSSPQPIVNPEAVTYPNTLTLSKVAANYTNVAGAFSLRLHAATQSIIQEDPAIANIALVLDNSGSMDTIYDYYPISFLNLDSSKELTDDLYENDPDPTTQKYYRYYVVIENVRYALDWKNSSKVWKYDRYGEQTLPSDTSYTIVQLRSRMDMLKPAAISFIEDIADISSGSKMAVITFNDNTSSTNLLTLNSASNVTTLRNKVSNMNGNDGTRHDLGLSKAYDMLKNQSGRNVVIMLTDGIPNDGTVGQNALRTATTMKSESMTIFTIGVFSFNDQTTKPWNSASISVAGYMTSLASTPVAPNFSPYYVRVTTEVNLTSILGTIVQEIGIKLNSVIKDYIDPHFDLIDASGTIVPINSNYTVENMTGRVKQDSSGIVYVEWEYDLDPGEEAAFNATLYVKPKEEFLGGNRVPTNQTASLTADGTVYPFPQPLVDVPLKFNLPVHDKSIYIGNSVSESDLYTPYDTQHSIMDDYVNITYTFGPEFNSQPEENASYNITATLVPTNATGTIQPKGFTKEGNTDATVYVFKPVITAADYGMYLGNTTDVSGHIDDSVWSCSVDNKPLPDTNGDGNADPAPAVTFSFATGAGVPIGLLSLNTFTPSSGGIQVITFTATANGKSVTPQDQNNTFNVYVFSPKLNCADSGIFLGETVDLDDNVTVTVWNCTDAPTTGLAMDVTDIPGVAYTFAAADAPATLAVWDTDTTTNIITPIVGDDHHFNIGSVTITGNATMPISFSGTDVEPYVAPVTSVAGYHFTVKVKTGTIIINKTGGAEGDSYLFTITDESHNALPDNVKALYAESFQDAIQADENGEGTVTITGLPKGTYTVTEDTDWSWRYGNVNSVSYTWEDNGDQTLGDKTGEAYDTSIACTVTNSNRIPFWLSGEAFAINRFSPYEQ